MRHLASAAVWGLAGWNGTAFIGYLATGSQPPAITTAALGIATSALVLVLRRIGRTSLARPASDPRLA